MMEKCNYSYSEAFLVNIYGRSLLYKTVIRARGKAIIYVFQHKCFLDENLHFLCNKLQFFGLLTSEPSMLFFNGKKQQP